MRRRIMVIIFVICAVFGSSVTVAAADTVGPLKPLPEPYRIDFEGTTDCGFLTPQSVAAAFAGPREGHLDNDVLRGDGSVIEAGDIVEGVVGVAVAYGGCGLSVEISLDSRYCKRRIFFTDCQWDSMASKKYTYDEVPTNGVRFFPALQAPLREGEHSYRLTVSMTGNKLKAVAGVDPQVLLNGPKGPIRTRGGFGLLLPEQTTQTGHSAEVKLSS